MIKLEVIECKGESGFQALLLLSQHFIGLLVFLDQLASQLIILPFQLLLSFLTHSHSFTQILYFLLFESNSFLERSQFPLNNAVPRGKCVCLRL